MAIRYKLFFALFLFVSAPCVAQSSKEKATTSGYVRDNSNGEVLIGATVYIKELGSGAVTNEYGFYSITLEKGDYTVQFSYVGFITQVKNLPLTENLRLDVSLDPESKQLQEIVVEGEDATNVKNLAMSTNKMRISTIVKMPSFLGEVDVLKSILMLPGVSTVGDGAAGFNVRGGSIGQNITLLDEAPVYNPSHVFGFFSVFNPDAVRDIQLYKGAIPARYGGRLASVLDIRMKEGNSKNLAVNGGIGTIFSRIAVEAPIVKDKASFIVAARRSYFDLFTSILVPELKNTVLNFYDVTLKANYTINKKNKLYVSGYLGRDNFKIDETQGFNWGNITSTMRWNHLYSDRLFSNTTLVYSRYDYQLLFNSTEEGNGIDWRSSISSFILEPKFTYFLNEKNEFNFGASATYYYFRPADATVKASTNTSRPGENNDIGIKLEEKYNLEAAVYVSNKQKIARFLSLEYGLRFSYFHSFGPGVAYQYDEGILGLRKPLLSSREYGAGDNISVYSNFEPRFSFKVQTGKNSSVKGSYNRMAQYLHLISNAPASNPLNVWVPSSNNIKPEIADQFTLGYFRTLGKKKELEVSIEGYYRQMQNQVGYIDGAELLLNKFLEGDLLSGQGRAYGVELHCQRKKGRLNGWVSYTLGRTELKIPGINRGEWYPTRYDQTHNVKVALFYAISNRVSASASFVYVSGTPTTFPTSRYRAQDVLLYHNAQESRNNIRIPDYNRLDISVRIQGKKVKRNGRKKKLIHYWDISFYNVYARKNPFSINFSIDDEGNAKATQLSIIGSIIPSFSWNFNFVKSKSN